MSIPHRPQKALQRYGDGFLFAAAVAVCLQILVAISTDLHLFGDGVWYLLTMVSTRHYAYWIADWSTQFFQSRIGTYLVVETPVVVAIHLGVHSLRALSKIFGCSLYLPWVLSIYICYRQTRERVYVLFPVLSLVAGSMNSGVFIINESHLMAALYWPVLFILLFQEELVALQLTVDLEACITTVDNLNGLETLDGQPWVWIAAIVYTGGHRSGVGLAIWGQIRCINGLGDYDDSPSHVLPDHHQPGHSGSVAIERVLWPSWARADKVVSRRYGFAPEGLIEARGRHLRYFVIGGASFIRGTPASLYR